MVFNFFLNTNLMTKNVPTNNEKMIKGLKSKVKEEIEKLSRVLYDGMYSWGQK